MTPGAVAGETSLPSVPPGLLPHTFDSVFLLVVSRVVSPPFLLIGGTCRVVSLLPPSFSRLERSGLGPALPSSRLSVAGGPSRRPFVLRHGVDDGGVAGVGVSLVINGCLDRTDYSQTRRRSVRTDLPSTVLRPVRTP